MQLVASDPTRNPFNALARTPGQHWSQLIVWVATTAVFPVVVFFGYVLAGDSLDSQVGRGQLLLVASTLTAPVVGALITLPGERTVGRSLLFLAAFVHVTITIFYFAPIADGTRDAPDVPSNSIWLYVGAVVLGACSVLVGARAAQRDAEQQVIDALAGQP